MNHSSYVVTLVLLGVTWPLLSQQTFGGSPGLSVKDGVLTLAEKPYRGIGANYFDLFYRTLTRHGDKSYEEGLRQLSQAGIPFVRFSCGGFWPIDWDLYSRDTGSYFTLLDGVVRAAEKHRIGLIPSLFWHIATVPDLVGEHVDQLGNSDSRTIAFIRRYTEEIVVRYKDSPAIWGWEFGNEYNLVADLPNAAACRPPVLMHLKTATTRTARDELRSEQMLTAFAEFARSVRRHDRHRIIITGNSVPRSCAYHNTKERSWKPDTIEQFNEILLRDNPDPIDTLSVHIYPEKDGKYPAGTGDLKSLIQAIQRMSVNAGKPLFIGEFGVPKELEPGKARSTFEEFLAAIETCRVPLAAFWVFDLSQQEKDWNITFTNERSYMIDLVAKANTLISQGR